MREADSLNAPGSVADYLENRVFIDTSPYDA
jgi:hypothetical protein